MRVSAVQVILLVLRSRRGTIATTFAVSATALLGMVALAAEGGVWQLQKRTTMTAADLGALAGAAAIEAGTNALLVATDAVSRNGFVQGGDSGRTAVTVNNPPLAGTYAGRADAVEVTVSQAQNLGMARLVLGAAPTVQSRAVAISAVDVNVCMLALDGGLGLGGNSTTNAQRCALAANSTQYGINIFGSATVRASDLVTTGACSGCSGGNVWTDDTRTSRPSVIAGRPNPIPDPYKNLQNWTPSPPACRSNINLRGELTISASDGAICSNLSVGPSDTLRLNPGLYYFNGASLDVRGTLTSTGTGGVTLVFTNSNNANDVGTITINAQSTVDLTGPSSTLISGHPEAKGLLMYRDARAQNNGSANQAKLNGGAIMRLVGSIYMPTTDLQVNGNSGSNYSTCMPIVGRALSFSGTADTRVDVSGCGSFAAVPQMRTPRLVE